jgi:quercetin dioxygenase-like cupin family protein
MPYRSGDFEQKHSEGTAMRKRSTRQLIDDGSGLGNDIEVRRVVTGHDANGKSVVLMDGPAPKTAFGLQVWSTDRAVADNDDATDGGLRKVGIGSEGGGHVIRIMSIPPGGHYEMHRTVSLDYGLILEGRLDLELDDGKTVHLGAGDVVVQRGTIHAWINPYDAPCKVAFIIMPAQPVHMGGQELPAVFH